jgi:hypothetical protein
MCADTLSEKSGPETVAANAPFPSPLTLWSRQGAALHHLGRHRPTAKLSQHFMKSAAPHSRCFEFYHSRLDTLLLVEEDDCGVRVRASRNTFSSRRKSCFIHELAAEGFISDRYEWFGAADPGGLLGVRWQVDASWVRINAAVANRARRTVFRWWFCATLLWLGMIALLVVC